jgi:hypothetical protein
VADFDALNVGGGVQRAGRALERDAEVAGARSGLRAEGGGRKQNREQFMASELP